LASLTRKAVINGITDLDINQIDQSWNTIPTEQWISSRPPIQISQPMLLSANALPDHTFLERLIYYKIKSRLTYDFFSSKYRVKSDLRKLLADFSHRGVGTATESVDNMLRGGISFSATIFAMLAVMGTFEPPDGAGRRWDQVHPERARRPRTELVFPLGVSCKFRGNRRKLLSRSATDHQSPAVHGRGRTPG
jgi:hypothetical protein